jgi:hypothetical protein
MGTSSDVCALYDTAKIRVFGQPGLVRGGAAGGWCCLELARLRNAGRLSLLRMAAA